MDKLKLNDEVKEKYKVLNYENYAEDGEVFINSTKSSLSFLEYHNEDNLRNYLLEILKNRFNLNGDKMEEKFKEAVSGDGKELNRICTLISSSLCAFLHFYNVSDSHPLKIKKEILGFKKDKNEVVEFTDVHFEVQNKVISNPSNVDVVLISNDKKTILFLESKFSEYLNLEKDKKVSSKYIEKYEEYNIHNRDGTYYKYEINPKNSKEIILSRADGCETYIEGVKQMISHHIGVRSFINDGYKCKIGRRTINMLKSDCEDYQVVLGEIVFNGWQSDEFEEYKDRFEKYKGEYENIRNMLRSYEPENEKKHDNLHIMENLLTYQELFGDNKDYKDNVKLLNEKIRKFYRYDK